MKGFVEPYRRYYPLLLVVLIGVVLRFIDNSARPYWGDEVLSLDIVRHFAHSIPQMLQYLREVEVHPPLYYLMLHYWVALFGDSPVAVRMLSTLAGIGVIVGVYHVAQQWYHRRSTAVLAAFLTAITPLQIALSSEARPYMLVCLSGLMTVGSLWSFLEHRQWKSLVLYVASAVVGFYLHYSSLLIVITTATVWCVDIIFTQEHQSRLRAFILWLSVHTMIVIGCCWWLDAMLYKMVLGWYPIFDAVRAVPQVRASTFFELMVNQLLWTTKQSTILPLFSATRGLAIIVFIASLWQALTLRSLQHVFWTTRRKNIRRYLALMLVLYLALFLFSPQSYPYRPLYVSHIALASILIILLAVDLAELFSPKRAIVVWSIVAISVFPFNLSIMSHDVQWNVFYQLEDAGDTINDQYQPGDLVISRWGYARTDLDHFLRPDVQAVSFTPINYIGLDIWNTRETLGLVENEDQSRTSWDTDEQRKQKLEYLIKHYQPKRVWLYGFSQKDNDIHVWFRDHHWRHVFTAIGDLLVLDLYSLK